MFEAVKSQALSPSPYGPKQGTSNLWLDICSTTTGLMRNNTQNQCTPSPSRFASSCRESLPLPNWLQREGDGLYDAKDSQYARQWQQGRINSPSTSATI